jgi:hypothetical protein
VYKAFNWGTGEAVAIKQIKLTDLPKSELRMMEVSPWKNDKIMISLYTISSYASYQTFERY